LGPHARFAQLLSHVVDGWQAAPTHVPKQHCVSDWQECPEAKQYTHDFWITTPPTVVGTHWPVTHSSSVAQCVPELCPWSGAQTTAFAPPSGDGT
jgi:hypothetical protein